MPAHADGARRCARAEQRARWCDSWKWTSPLVKRLHWQAFAAGDFGCGPATAGCRGVGGWGHSHFAPAKSAKAASRGTQCHGVRDKRPLQDLRSSRKTAKHPSGSAAAEPPISQQSLFQNWGKAPCAFAGVVAGPRPWGDASPHRAGAPAKRPPHSAGSV